MEGSTKIMDGDCKTSNAGFAYTIIGVHKLTIIAIMTGIKTYFFKTLGIVSLRIQDTVSIYMRKTLKIEYAITHKKAPEYTDAFLLLLIAISYIYAF